MRLAGQHGHPLGVHRDDRVVHAARPVVELTRRGGDEAATGEDVTAEVGEPRVGDGQQPRAARRGGLRPLPDLAAVDLARRAQRGQLQLLLGAEVAEHAALAHLQVGGQAPDRQALQPFERGEVDGALEDRGPGAGGIGGGAAGHTSANLSVRSVAIDIATDRSLNARS